jgi:hypothetical protein
MVGSEAVAATSCSLAVTASANTSTLATGESHQAVAETAAAAAAGASTAAASVGLLADALVPLTEGLTGAELGALCDRAVVKACAEVQTQVQEQDQMKDQTGVKNGAQWQRLEREKLYLAVAQTCVRWSHLFEAANEIKTAANPKTPLF